MTPWYAECVTTVSLFIHILFWSSRGPTRKFPVLSPRSSGCLTLALGRPESGHIGCVLLQAECHIGRQVQNAVLVLKVFGMDNVAPPYALAVFLPESVQG